MDGKHAQESREGGIARLQHLGERFSIHCGDHQEAASSPKLNFWFPCPLLIIVDSNRCISGLSSAALPAPFERPACPRCKAQMMLVSIEPESPGVDLHRSDVEISQAIPCQHEFFPLGWGQSRASVTALARLVIL
jgi:hypothetical protein